MLPLDSALNISVQLWLKTVKTNYRILGWNIQEISADKSERGHLRKKGGKLAAPPIIYRSTS
jgi:hypothetical protein